ncbi:XrtA/PEP-CTERM system TPR-repeat protein PrsT [Aquabacterium sp. OR-4]|uniref:XrtA/PEP-CTERM system TPR-repeat protein PrsT n=1 Tax=Aquabacterium sp. OR-4 TaxID=2978127 RepID=UPI0028CAA90E|nr:XrtA/PEP-CTERM system TPR-repeat protein PrsT [Aquabacterium sp. OR-4]MDT7837715.1 PEP-CTERM system TPR-repeat protein PrsT [Aquabacterium sp. OR-4]
MSSSSSSRSHRSSRPGGSPKKPLLGKTAKIVLALGVGAAVVAAAVVMVPRLLATEASQLARARELIGEKSPESAKVQLKAMLQEHPSSAEGRFLLGQLLLQTGDPAGAEAELRRALEAGHPDTAVLPVLAQAMLAQGKGKLLVLQFGKNELAEAQADAELKTAIAQAEASEGDLGAAEEALAQALRRAPELPAARLMQARLAAARGDLPGALKQAQALTAAQAGNAPAWVLQGDLLLQQAGAAGDAAPALAAYRKALELDGKLIGTHLAVINALLARRDLAGATQQWAALDKVAHNQPQTLFYEAVLADSRGEHKRVREITQQLLRGAPENPRVLLLAGQAELKLGATAQAEALLGKAVQLYPRSPAPRRLLATALLRSGQADKALLTLKPLVEANPPDAEALALSAQAHLMKGDSKAAESEFARAGKLRPDDTRLQTALAVTQLSKGQDNAGFAALEDIAAKDKGTSADLTLISARMRRNDVAGALKAVDALAVKMPKEPLPEQLRGRIALQAKDLPGARKHFEAALAKQADYLPAVSGLAMLDLSEKKPDAARARFTQVLERNPKHVGAMLAMAEINQRGGGKPDDTLKWLDDAVKADPGDVRARVLLIEHHLGQRDTPRALSAAQAAASAVPDNPELLDRLGRVQLLARDGQQAVASFGKLAQLMPQSPMPQLRLADAHTAARNPAAAAAAVRRAQEIAPDAPQVLQAAMQLALSEGKTEQALSLARKLQAQRPDDAAGFIAEGDAALRARQSDNAIAAYRKALAKKAPGEAAQRLYMAYTAAGKKAEADKLATEWRQSHPDDLGFVLHLGDMAMAGKDLARAEQLYRTVVDKLPSQAVALNNLAYVLAAQKKAGGVAMAERALKLAPEAPAMLDTLAFALAAEGQLPKALETQARAVSLAPDTPNFRLQLARLLLQKGDKPAARLELDKLAKLGAAFPRQAEVAELLKQAG